MSLRARMTDPSRASDTSNVATIVVFSFGRSAARLATFRSSIWATRTWRSCEGQHDCASSPVVAIIATFVDLGSPRIAMANTYIVRSYMKYNMQYLLIAIENTIDSIFDMNPSLSVTIALTQDNVI